MNRRKTSRGTGMRRNAKDSGSLTRLYEEMFQVLESADDTPLREDYEDELGGAPLLSRRLGTPDVHSLSNDRLVTIIQQMNTLGRSRGVAEVLLKLLDQTNLTDQQKSNQRRVLRGSIHFIDEQLWSCVRFLRVLRDRIPE